MIQGGNKSENHVLYTPPDLLYGEGVYRCLGVGLDSFDFAVDVLRGFGGLLSQFLHFVGHYGKAFARVARGIGKYVERGPAPS
jgi:hypothetical protein